MITPGLYVFVRPAGKISELNQISRSELETGELRTANDRNHLELLSRHRHKKISSKVKLYQLIHKYLRHYQYETPIAF